MTDNSPKAVVLRMMELYNDGTPESYGSDRFLEVFAEGAVQEFLPSNQFPAGSRLAGKAAIRANLIQVSDAWRDRRWIAPDIVAADGRVAVRSTWSAVAGVPVGAMPKGAAMHLECADFYRVENGFIVSQVNLVGPPLPGRGAPA